MKMITKDWFASWFDTSFYHILYQHRNDDEAQYFMRNLIAFLDLKPHQTILDLACGRGRHSVFLNKLGFNVKGLDLSKNSILYAKPFENLHLKFSVHDMRKPLNNSYDAIFNLFTSFGYFDNDQDDIQVLKNIKNGLKPKGVAVIDFMNVHVVKQHLVAKEDKTLNGILFNITRQIKDGFIVKNISFSSEGKDYQFQERVKCLSLEKIKSYLKTADLTLKHTFGNYKLDAYDLETSTRLILVVS